MVEVVDEIRWHTLPVELYLVELSHLPLLSVEKFVDALWSSYKTYCTREEKLFNILKEELLVDEDERKGQRCRYAQKWAEYRCFSNELVADE